ncbi:hypothetical protein GCM10025734_50960 [Kitasatospora paranensis]
MPAAPNRGGWLQRARRIPMGVGSAKAGRPWVGAAGRCGGPGHRSSLERGPGLTAVRNPPSGAVRHPRPTALREAARAPPRLRTLV